MPTADPTPPPPHGAALPPVSIEQGKVRVLSLAVARQTEELEAESRAFVQKVVEFTTAVHGVVDGLGAQAAVIEREKLKAIGQRNLVEAERETRRRKQREVQALVDEKLAELARQQTALDSLLLVSCRVAAAWCARARACACVRARARAITRHGASAHRN